MMEVLIVSFHSVGALQRFLTENSYGMDKQNDFTGRTSEMHVAGKRVMSKILEDF